MVAVSQVNGARRSRASVSRVTVYRTVALVVIIALWEIAGASGLFFRGVIPSSVFVIAALFKLLGSPVFWGHFGVTLFEIVTGFVIGSALGMLGGLGIGMNRYAGRIFEPVVEYLA